MLVARKDKYAGVGCFGWVILFIVIVGVFAFRQPQEKKYKVEFTMGELNDLIYCLKQSNAPAIATNKLIDIISNQVDPVLRADQKAITDSLNKKKN